jgi:hypothetical protein
MKAFHFSRPDLDDFSKFRLQGCPCLIVAACSRKHDLKGLLAKISLTKPVATG